MGGLGAGGMRERAAMALWKGQVMREQGTVGTCEPYQLLMNREMSASGGLEHLPTWLLPQT